MCLKQKRSKHVTGSSFSKSPEGKPIEWILVPPVPTLKKSYSDCSKACKWTGENASDVPVVCVTWQEAHAFCLWYSEQLNASRWKVRLPTRREWEFFARAGIPDKYPCGEHRKDHKYGSLQEIAWFNKKDPDPKGPRKVSSFNPWGIGDLHGNVWEWCQSDFDQKQHSLCGGSWRSGAADLAFPNASLEAQQLPKVYPSDFAQDTVGFRCILELQL